MAMRKLLYWTVMLCAIFLETSVAKYLVWSCVAVHMLVCMLHAFFVYYYRISVFCMYNVMQGLGSAPLRKEFFLCIQSSIGPVVMLTVGR